MKLRPTSLLAACLALFATTALAQHPHVEYSHEDPAKVTTAEACGECHVSALEVWKKTTHATGFKTLHRRKAAETIAGKLGFLLVKRDSVCIKCHYTAQVQNEQLRAVSGISCESCHGAGADWIDLHNDYGGKGFDHTNETAEHRAERIAASRAAGMKRSSDIYPAVASCFRCHTVPEERLVNVGGHPAGSGDFELVAWSQGEIRHNFLESIRGGASDNAERSVEHKRRLYVVGRALELEYGLRGVAAATEKGTYLSATIRRVRQAAGEVRALARRAQAHGIEGSELDQMVAAVRGVRVGLGDRDALVAAADQVGAAARSFLERHDGTQLAAFDPLMLGTAEDDDVLLAEDDELEDDPAALSAGDAAVGEVVDGTAVAASADGSTAPAGAAAGTPAGAPAAAARPARQAIPAVGEIRTRIRPASSFKTLGPGPCTSCHRHSEQSGWWFDDAHFAAADAFFEQSPNNVRIARLYGIRPRGMTRGDKLCMDCHGTVVSGKERREVSDGVSCESCHGPAAQYLEPHQEGDKAQGTSRSGYVQALQLGMAEVKDLDVVAKTCTGCHYITDQRLLSAGHPSGAGFDYTGGMTRIAHWEHPTPTAGALNAAFQSALGARGGVPEVRLARLAGPAPSGPAPSGVVQAGAAGTSGAATAAPYRPQTPRAAPGRGQQWGASTHDSAPRKESSRRFRHGYRTVRFQRHPGAAAVSRDRSGGFGRRSPSAAQAAAGAALPGDRCPTPLKDLQRR